MQVQVFDTPHIFMDAARPFLIRSPVINNLLLTLASDRLGGAEPGRYWVVRDDTGIIGAALHSPFNYPLTLSDMPLEAAVALAEAVADEGHDLPGVAGMVQNAAAFAGHLSGLRKIPAAPLLGQRLYEAAHVTKTTPPPGSLRVATMADFALVHAWLDAFQAEATTFRIDNAPMAERRIRAGEMWLWVDEEAAAMAATTQPIAGVARVQAVFTPPDKRRRGYAQALVSALTQAILDKGARPILYTDLANPTPNSVYQRIGYSVVAELIRYRFG